MISKAVIELIKTQPFFAHVVLNMNRIYSNATPTAGVGIKDGINLHINPTFWARLTLKEQTAVLVHEVYHIIYNHISRGKNIGKFNKAMNAAADIAINQYIEGLPEGALTLDMLRAEIPDIEPHQTMEYYYSKIKSLNKDMESMDDHDQWEESEYSDEVVRDALNRAEEAVRRSNGSIPGNVAIALQKINSSKNNWKSQLKRFVSKQGKINRMHTRKRRNRRYGIAYPGKKQEPRLNIAIAIDTSGSISDDSLVQFFTEINSIYKNDVRIHIIECDADVSASYEYNPRDPIKVHGRGGTMFQPAFDKANDLDIDGLIYFTDGDSFDTPNKPKYNVLWALVNGGSPNVPWGSKIRI